MTAYSADFEDQIRDLLSNLYDYLKLAENGAAQQLAADAKGGERVNAIHEAVHRAIDHLRSDKTTIPTARQNRLYSILQLRYVEELNTTTVLERLALSERQYYREHQRAIQTISRVLWDRYFTGAVLESGEASLSLAEELDYLNVDNSHKVFQARDEILAAIKATGVLAMQRGIEIALQETRESVSLSVSQPVFRQLVIYLLNELIGATGVNGGIEIGLGVVDGAPMITFQVEGALVAGEAVCARLTAAGSPRELMKSLKAELHCAGEPPLITLSFAGAIHKILIVDDNPDTVSLFKRYLANQPYQILAAPGEMEALQIARQTRLLCIILDIMLPGKDGWQILQKL